MADRVLRRFGRIDLLVNNSGCDKADPFVDSDPAGPPSVVPPHPWHRLDLVIGRALKPPAPGTSFEGGHDR
jgi:NAD(P)-dependent dehydrogenase (short-subunit alcohol dehydrogenase family)